MTVATTSVEFGCNDMASSNPLTFMFKDDGAVPNNPVLPALVYKGAIDIDAKRDPVGKLAAHFEFSVAVREGEPWILGTQGC